MDDDTLWKEIAVDGSVDVVARAAEIQAARQQYVDSQMSTVQQELEQARKQIEELEAKKVEETAFRRPSSVSVPGEMEAEGRKPWKEVQAHAAKMMREAFK